MGPWCFNILLAAFWLHQAEGKSIVEVLYFGNCRESDLKAMYHLEDTHFGMISSDTSAFNATVVFTRDMDLVGAKVKVYKCKSVEESSCELVLTVPIKDTCLRQTEKGQFYAVLAEHANPPLSCPYKKRTYRVTNVAVNINSVANFAQENVVYIFKFIFDYHGQYAGCFKAAAKKVTVRSRKNKNN